MLKKLILFTFSILFLGFFSQKSVFAIDCKVVEPRGIIQENAQSISVVITGVDTVDKDNNPYRYRLATKELARPWDVYAPTSGGVVADANGTVRITFNKSDVDSVFFTTHPAVNPKNLHLDRNEQLYCENITYQVGAFANQCQPVISPISPQENDPITLSLRAAPTGNYNVCVDFNKKGEITVNADGTATNLSIPAFTYNSNTTHSVGYEYKSVIDSNCTPPNVSFTCASSFSVVPSAGKPPQPVAPLPPGTLPAPAAPGLTGPKASAGGEPCGTKENPGFQTAIGCIHTNPVEFVKDFMKFVIAIAGGFAFLLMLMGAFQMVTSAGNPDSLNAGRERLTSAIIGLLFVIFAVLLLQIIGVDILRLPGFTRV